MTAILIKFKQKEQWNNCIGSINNWSCIKSCKLPQVLI
jgi:hypothetical protein